MRGKNRFFKGNRWASPGLAIIAALLVFTGVLAADELLDPGFGTGGIVTSSFGGITDRSNHVLLQADGRIIISGVSQNSGPFVARYNSNGTVETFFGVNGSMVPAIGLVADFRVSIQTDGKLVVAGSSNGRIVLALYNSNGTSLDPAFGTNGVVIASDSSGFSRYSVSDLAIESDGRIVVVGTESNQGNFTNVVIARFNTDGTPYETDFFNGLIILDKTNFPNNRFNNGRAVVIQPDGRIVVSGDMVDDDGRIQITLVRLNKNSSLDSSTFGTNGKGTVVTPLSNFQNSNGALALQADGKIVVAGTLTQNIGNTNENLALARFNKNGSLDTTFGGTGIVTTDLGNNENVADLVIQPNGKILLVGKISASNFSDILLVRYNSNGSLDNTFGVNGKIIKDIGNLPDSGNAIALQPDGLVVLAGSSSRNAILARYIVDFSSHPVRTSSFKSAGAQDGWVLESAETSNSGGTLNRTATTILVGDDAKDRQYRGFLSFNTASLPDQAIITSAHLDVRRQGFVGANPFSAYGDLLMEMRSGAFSNSLALQLTDFNSAASQGANQEHFSPLTAVWYTAPLSSNNLRFINKSGITQFRLLFALDDNDDMGADHLKLFSGEAVDANRPRLVVTYFVP